jgi:hypothetical protein
LRLGEIRTVIRAEIELVVFEPLGFGSRIRPAPASRSTRIPARSRERIRIRTCLFFAIPGLGNPRRGGSAATAVLIFGYLVHRPRTSRAMSSAGGKIGIHGTFVGFGPFT